MTKNKDSYINAHLGRVNIYTKPNGVIISQKQNGGMENMIILSPEDMGKLGRALLAKQRESFPDSLPPKKAAPLQQPVSPSIPVITSNVTYSKAYAPGLQKKRIYFGNTIGKERLLQRFRLS